MVRSLLFDVALDVLGVQHVPDERHHPLGQVFHNTCVAWIA